MASFLVKWIDTRISQMLQAPGMWGSLEAVELQTLTLLEVRYQVCRPFEDLNRQVLDAYEAQRQHLFPTEVSQPLHQIFKDDETGFVLALRTLVVFIKSLQA